MISIEEIRTAFRNVKARYDARGRTDGLICKHGFYDSCPVIKLQKASWTNDPMSHDRNRSGIFFSVWTDDKVKTTNRAKYNIHALKLRELEGHRIASRDFAEEFRRYFSSARKDWPNVSIDYGPLTLMEGWLQIDRHRFEDNVLLLMDRFEQLAPVIDELLDRRRIRAGRRG